MRSKMSGQEDVLQYCRDRLECYIILEKRYGHERARRMLSLYDLERGDAEMSEEQFELKPWQKKVRGLIDQAKKETSNKS